MSEGWKNFPIHVLVTIDKLWLHYSQGKFGFSVQKSILSEMGFDSGELSWKEWEKLGCYQMLFGATNTIKS